MFFELLKSTLSQRIYSQNQKVQNAIDLSQSIQQQLEDYFLRQNIKTQKLEETLEDPNKQEYFQKLRLLLEQEFFSACRR